MQSFNQGNGAPQNPAVAHVLSRQTRKFLHLMYSAGIPPLESLAPNAARQLLAGAQNSVPVDLSEVDVLEKTIFEDGFSIRLYVVKPKKTSAILPGFLFLHGGGFMLGDFNTHSRLVRDLVMQSGSAGIFVDYSLSPEFRYPRAINECFAALKWLSVEGKSVGVDGNRLAIVGNSAGANLATVTTLLAKERKGPAIRLQVLLWPNLGTNFARGTYDQFGTGHILDTTLVAWFWKNYTANEEEYRDYHVCPSEATLQQLEGLPPALIQVAEADVLREEGEEYGKMLDEAGVEVTTIRYGGVIHDFAFWNAQAANPQVKSLIITTAAHLAYYLK